MRWVLTKGKLPASAWIEVITTAHELGIPTTATMMYGHVDTPAHWVGHLRVIRGIQERTGGFTEFVLLPFVHASAPIYLAGLARPGPTRRENRAVHALSRLMLHGAIGNIQCSWVKLSGELCRDVLRGGANDIGGTLMEETISRMAGLAAGLLQDHQRHGGHGRPARPPPAAAHHPVRHAASGPPGGVGGQRRRVRVRPWRPHAPPARPQLARPPGS